MAISSDIGIVVRSCGVIVGATRVDRMIDFRNLLRVLSDIVQLDLSLYSLKVSSVYTDGNGSPIIPIKNNGDIQFFFHPNAGLNSVELLVEPEILVRPQASHIAWGNQYNHLVGHGHGGGNDTNAGPFGSTNSSIIGDLPGDQFGANYCYLKPSENGSSDEDSSDGDAEEEIPRVAPDPDLLAVPFFASVYKGVPFDLIYNADFGVLSIGMIFGNKNHLQSAVKDYSVRHARREFRVVESSSTSWKIVCKKNPANDIDCSPISKYCQWLLRGKFTRKHMHWVITALGLPHSCLTDTDSKSHKSICKNLLAVDMESNAQMEHERTCLKLAEENMFGSWENSCQYLPKFMGALQKYNHGTIVEWRHKDGIVGTLHTLGYVFWAFKPCVEAFKHCRKVLTVGSTYLYTKYKHKLLIANTIDADQKIIPVAYAIVIEENFQSWYWFLQRLATHVVRDVEEICLISDKQQDLLKAMEYVPAFHPPRCVHRYCLRHVASDVNTQYQSLRLRDLCYKAGKSLSPRDFELTMNEIKNLNYGAYVYLNANPRKWTLCHDGGYRFGVMTTNISEVINGILKGTRHLPITDFVSATFTRSKNAFWKCKEVALELQKKNQSWPDHILYLFDTERRLGMKHHVDLHNFSRQTASVTTCVEGSRHRDNYVVSLTEEECSCGQWEFDRIPCSHAMEVCRQYGVNPTMYVHRCYSTNAYVLTYTSGWFWPLQNEEEWDEPYFQLKHNPDRRIRHRGREHQVKNRAGPSHQGSASHRG